jgi:predicted esterase
VFPYLIIMNRLITSLAVVLLLAANSLAALPEKNGSFTIAAQEWPFEPGPRTVLVAVEYPGTTLASVNEQTGIILSLHNWGGTGSGGAPHPRTIAYRLNAICISVDYLQSGKISVDPNNGPYDFGYLQGLDALRALFTVFDGLNHAGIKFDKRRIFATGGSGGGNVSLMVNKLAPRTFTAIIDMCGMAKLNDDIAFNLPGGSSLDARWSKDPTSKRYLSPDAQEIRDNGHVEHAKIMKQLGNSAHIISVHGVDDTTCPYSDKQTVIANLKSAGLNAELVPVDQAKIDGKVFLSTGHSLGNRTEIVFAVAGNALLPNDSARWLRSGATDFERRETIVYPTSNGRFAIDYAEGFPVARFESK